MPDDQDLTDGSRFATSVPPRHEPFGLRGCGALDWGMQSRLARVFRPATGRTVMLAIDHGYFQARPAAWSGSTCRSCRCCRTPTR